MDDSEYMCILHRSCCSDVVCTYVSLSLHLVRVFALQWSEPWSGAEVEVYVGESSSQAQENNGCQYLYMCNLTPCTYCVYACEVMMGSPPIGC